MFFIRATLLSDTSIMICAETACFVCRDTAISWSTVPCYSSRGHPTNHSTGYPTKTSIMQQFHIRITGQYKQSISCNCTCDQNHLTWEYLCLNFLYTYSPDLSVCYTLYRQNNVSIFLRIEMNILASLFQKQ